MWCIFGQLDVEIVKFKLYHGETLLAIFTSFRQCRRLREQNTCARRKRRRQKKRYGKQAQMKRLTPYLRIKVAFQIHLLLQGPRLQVGGTVEQGEAKRHRCWVDGA